MSQKKPKGSVTVIGGGISGIQTALSLVDAGYGVHLIERSASLGGMMPNLHRIYPLCNCCKLDPRIAACEQDPNINVMVDASVTEISGKLGKFKISIETGGKKEDIETAVVILAAGLETFDPSRHDSYSYGQFPNVLTSVEYEQLQKPLGPGGEVLQRNSDGKLPEKIAWLQCVGSRDINQCDAPYCSSVCCMYALKEAVNTKDINEDIETTIFYMDMRTHGKGYEDYLNEALEKGVRLIRSRIHTVDSITGSDDLTITYADENGRINSEIFNLVVLSVGIKPSEEAIELSRKMGVNLNQDQFIEAEPFKPVVTNIPGFLICGGISGPHDISQSIIQATSTVSEVSALLDPELLKQNESYPDAIESSKEPAVLVAYHLCSGMSPQIGKLLKGYVNNSIVKASIEVKGDIRNELVEKIKSTGANRLVFASCTPIIHKNLIEDSLRKSGINPYLYEMVDLRLVEPENASIQLDERIRLGIAKAALISPPLLHDIPVSKQALVVGGGIAGLESAIAISKAGYPVTLVEKNKELGGNGVHIKNTWRGHDVQKYLKDIVSLVNSDKNITVMTDTRVKNNRGFCGNFLTTLENNGKDIDLQHGVTILAPGSKVFRPDEYFYGVKKNVFLWSEFGLKTIHDPASIENAETAVFIQCVGSREPERPHCSNVCCSFAVRSAIDLKEKNPEINIYVLYREMRTFGERESLYREARRLGVVFIRYDLHNKPVVETIAGTDRLKVTVFDPIIGKNLTFTADFISLQTAIVAENSELADIFKINLDDNGFFAESPEKMKPMDSSSNGIFVAGLASYPKGIGESISQAKGAAARALEILNKDFIQIGGSIAEVMAEKCAVCCTCVRSCPFRVPYIDSTKGAAFIDPGLCQGCGICVAECPGKAIIMSTCSDRMLTEASSVLLKAS